MKNILFIVLTFMSIGSFAQSKEEKEALKAAMNSKKLTYQGNESLKGDKPTQAEVDYRNAIAEDNTNLTAQYNLGTLLYKQKNYGEAFAQISMPYKSLKTVRSSAYCLMKSVSQWHHLKRLLLSSKGKKSHNDLVFR